MGPEHDAGAPAADRDPGGRHPPTLAELQQAGVAAGLHRVGVAPAGPFVATRRHLEERKAAGLHGGMQFTYRNPARSTEPGRILAGARTLVVAALAYPAPGVGPVGGGPVGDGPGGGGPDGGGRDGARPAGRVARYARADHYAALRRGLGVVADLLAGSGWRAVVVADDNALVDREAAVRAGLGWYGKNANVLLPGAGSWFVLGSVVTDAPIEAEATPVPEACGRCRRCLDGCPTGAIVAPGVVDARRCLAWLVQAPGPVPRALRVAMGDRIYGCDDCQEVCPPNRSPVAAPVADDPGPTVDLLDLLRADDADLLTRFGRWYIAGRDPDHLRRNALVALGNIGDPDDPAVLDVVEHHLRDGSPLVQAHAVWAARRLGRDDLLAATGHPDSPAVHDELVAPVEPRTPAGGTRR